jgi:tight adherence protein B
MRLRIAIVTALAALVAAVPASASGTLQVQKVDTSAFPTVRVTVQSPTPGKAPDLQVSENGVQVPSANVQMVDPGAPAAIALVIDTSNSMAGTKLNDAISAAHGFVSAQKNGNLLGVYGFDSTAYPAARLSPDRTEIDTAISQLGTGGAPGTALYGAVKLASADLQTAPAQRRVMILITDGSSQSDTATLDEAVAAAKQAGVLVYTVGIATSGPAQAALNQIATDTGGTATSVTDSSALAGIYSTIESELGNSYTYMYQSSVAPGAPLVLTLSSPGLGDAREVLKAPGTFVPPTKSSGGLKLPTGASGRILMAALVGFFVLMAMILVMAARPDVILQKRIAPYTDSKKSVVVEADGEATPTSRISLLHQLFISTERIIGSMNFWKRMSANLEQADLPLRTAELFYIQIGTAILFGFITAFILGHRGLFALAAVLLGALVPAIYVRLKAKKRLTLFESQLPETLITMAASLKAGHAFNQSVSSVVREGADPTAKEFSRVLAEIQLGSNSENALQAMADRMNSYNFGFVVMAVNIQRTVGGSLADILDMVSDTVRQRQQFERKVKALTAQGRMSAYVLIAMPFLMGLAIFALNPTYMSVLFTTTMGKVMVAGGLVMMGIGSMIIKKIVSFKE